MPRHQFDKGSKYLVQKHTRGILFLGGATGIRSCRAVQSELVQPRRLPDGLIEVLFEGQKEPDYVLVEVATYPEKRALDQALDDLTLARGFLKGALPEMLTLVLRPKGKFQIDGRHGARSRLGWSELNCKWKVVEVWTLPAEELLKADVGAVPFATLARYDGPPEELLERCRDRIEQEADASDRENLLTVSQVFAQLKFPNPQLLALLGGKHVMIESPLIQDLVAEKVQNTILEVLKARFDTIPVDVRRLLGEVKKESKLMKLAKAAGRCTDLDEFKELLLK